MSLCGSLPTRIPQPRRHTVAEAIVRINLESGFGALQLDFADGEVRHHVALDAEEVS